MKGNERKMKGKGKEMIGNERKMKGKGKEKPAGLPERPAGEENERKMKGE